LATCSQEDWQHRFHFANFQEWRDFSPPNVDVCVEHLKVAQCLSAGRRGGGIRTQKEMLYFSNPFGLIHLKKINFRKRNIINILKLENI